MSYICEVTDLHYHVFIRTSATQHKDLHTLNFTCEMTHISQCAAWQKVSKVTSCWLCINPALYLQSYAVSPPLASLVHLSMTLCPFLPQHCLSPIRTSSCSLKLQQSISLAFPLHTSISDHTTLPACPPTFTDARVHCQYILHQTPSNLSTWSLLLTHFSFHTSTYIQIRTYLYKVG